MGVVLALAATLFAQTPVSAIVVDAGRGGEYDEAHLVEANISVLTPIMLEHAELERSNEATFRTKFLALHSPKIIVPRNYSQMSASRAILQGFPIGTWKIERRN